MARALLLVAACAYVAAAVAAPVELQPSGMRKVLRRNPSPSVPLITSNRVVCPSLPPRGSFRPGVLRGMVLAPFNPATDSPTDSHYPAMGCACPRGTPVKLN